MRKRFPPMAAPTMIPEESLIVTWACDMSSAAGVSSDVTSALHRLAAGDSGSTAELGHAMTAVAHGPFTSPRRATSVTTFAAP